MPLLHAHIPFSRIPEHIGLIRDKKLDLEIYFQAADLDVLSGDGIDSLKSDLDYGPSLSFHAPFMDLSPGAIDSQIRSATLRRFSHVFDIADILKPKIVVFHSGYEKWKYALHTDLWLKKSLETWQPMNRRAEAMGVKIAIENIFEDEPSSLRLLMEQMSSPNFGICFDTGHFNIFSITPLESWMEMLNPFIIELHLHDNDRSSDQHLPVGEGSFAFTKFFSLLANRDCVHTIEAHSPEKVMLSMQRLTHIIHQFPEH